MPNASEIEEEQIHFANVIATFNNYSSYSLTANNRRRKDFYTLPLADRQLLEALGYKEKLSAVDDAILTNAKFLESIVANPEIFGHDLSDADVGVGEDGDETIPTVSHEHAHPHPHSHSHSHSHSHGGAGSHTHDHTTPVAHGPRKKYRPTEFDMDKLRSTLKQFVRDWSAEGKTERDASYEPIKEALISHFSHVPESERSKLQVLVPGAGLGRLAYDVAKLGFSCQGNEFSHYMLLASYLVLNRTDKIDAYTIYPYVHSFSNVADRHAMLRSVTVPDVLPTDLPRNSNFSLVAGDFEEIYGARKEDYEDDEDVEFHEGAWDAVLTCFFIDTAKNIVNYLRIIHYILNPGGVWINLGPLLWHWENNTTNDPSIELDLEEVKQLARKIGFEISNERTIKTTYTSNKEAMLGYTYDAAFWTATKITS